MKSIKKITWSFLNFIRVGGILQLVLKSALKDDGWFLSFHTKKSVDRLNNPLPWNTYSFIYFLEPRLKKSMDVFEFGCGNSTRWYAPRVKSIKAVEHNKGWFEYMKNNLPSNAELVYHALSEGSNYSQEVMKGDLLFHIVIVDGEDRNNCLENSLRKLAADGVVVYDNSERPEYERSFSLLASAGFKRLDFYGMGPINQYNSCTSVFYKSNNCLAI